MAKRLNTLFRHGRLEEDGATEFWRLKDDLSEQISAQGGGNKKRFQYCTDPSGQEILYFRVLQGHSRRNPIDFTLQDNVLIPNNFFEYIHHIGCAVSANSITNSGFIAGRGREFKQGKTDSILCSRESHGQR